MNRRSAVRLLACLALLIPQAFAQGLSQPTEFRVKLLGPISTETNQKGDKITAQVITPVLYRGAIMEGEIKESKSGGKIKGTSVLNFSFDQLVQGSSRLPVKSSVDSVFNSKGKENVDEEGRVIRKKNNLGKAAVAAGAGAIIGAIIGGGQGAAIGAGIGAAAGLVLIQVAAEGANVTFAVGSEFLLSVQERDRR